MLSVDFFGAVNHAAIWDRDAIGELVLGVEDLGNFSAGVLGLQFGLDDVLGVGEEPAGEATNSTGHKQLMEF